ncbi:MAG TPA: SBBP repeat-containing protein, partial [Acidobacteriota bacterium]|nr:SBBP repeat-containing protein [Acidobacteriota bacterium]
MIRMELLESRISAPEGRTPLNAQLNFLRGNQPDQWQVGVQAYESVIYREVYFGVDLVFHGNAGEFEYDFRLQAGADPSLIRFRFSSSSDLELMSEGDLRLKVTGGFLRMRKPKAYQKIGGVRRWVECDFVVDAQNQVSFRVGSYDETAPLVIDPVFSYSSFIGGSHADQINDIEVAADGSVFVTGTTQSLDFPVSSGPFESVAKGRRDVFLMKFRPDKTLAFATFLGGSGDDDGFALAVNSAGQAAIVGSTNSPDFPLEKAFQNTAGGGTSDAFLVVVSGTDSSLVYSTFLGGSGEDVATSVTATGGQELIVTGYTRSSNFPVQNALEFEFQGIVDVFITKINPSGSAPAFSTYLGGARDDLGRQVLVDSQGNILVAGTTRSTDFPLEAAYQSTAAGSDDSFLVKLDGSGQLLFSTYLGGNSSDLLRAAALGSDDSVYLVGETTSTSYPVKFPLQSRRAGGTDCFISRISSSGAELLYSTYLGGSNNDSCRSVVVDSQQNIYLAGGTFSIDFPEAGNMAVKQGGLDALLAKLDPEGATLLFSTLFGGSSGELIHTLAITDEGGIVVGGAVDSLDFPLLNPFQDGFGGAGIFRSTTDAQNWNPSSEGPGNRNVEALAVDILRPSRVYAGTSGGVFRSDDNGVTWHSTGLTEGPIYSVAVDPSNSRVLYAGTIGGVFKSDDEGETWVLQTAGLPPQGVFQALVVDPVNPAIAYAGTEQRGVFKTTDGGDLWRAVNNGLDDDGKRIFSLAIDPTDSDRLYIGTRGRVMSTINGANSWESTSLTGVGDVRALAITSSSVLYASGVVAGASIVARSQDGGANWTAQPIGGAVSELVVHPSNPAVLWAGTFDSGVLKSSDTALTWEAANTGLPIREIRALVFSGGSPGSLIAGVNSGSDGFLVELESDHTFYFPQIADGQDARIKFQTTLIFVNTGPATPVRIEFFDSHGAPLELTLGDLGSGAVFEIHLASGESFSIQTPGEGPVKVGYARVMTSDRVGGTAIFARSDALVRRNLYEAGVPASTARSMFSFFLDSLGTRDTGVAIVNPPDLLPGQDGLAQITLQLSDQDGNPLDNTVLELEPGEHRAAFVAELFSDIALQASEMRGLVTAVSDRPVVAVTLRQSDDPNVEYPNEVASLTAFPVLPLNNLKETLYFAQVGDGPAGASRFRTSFVLANTGTSTASVQLHFFDSNGNPMELVLGSSGPASSYQFSIAPGLFRFLETPGGDTLKVGYARITSNSVSVGGTAVFSEVDVEREIILYETGV